MASPRQAPAVSTVMQTGLITTGPMQLLAEAHDIMLGEGVRQLPVVENGQLVGIISESDLSPHSGYLGRTKVDAAMTTEVVTVGPNDDVVRAAHVLIDKQLSALPVVEGGRLLGMISRTDLLKLFVGLFE